MARITVEDCLEKVDSRFELVLAATKRARQLVFSGLEAQVPWEGDKPTVVALREIASGLIDPKKLDDLERARQQELQAAEAGVSDSFMSGQTLLTEQQPALQQASSMPSQPEPTAASSRLHTLSSTPSLFEQVASQTGPVKIIDDKAVAADAIVESSDSSVKAEQSDVEQSAGDSDPTSTSEGDVEDDK